MKLELTEKIFKIISDVAYESSLKAFVIGGYVRDRILNRVSKDIDVVVLGSGIEMAQKVAHSIDSRIHVAIFKNFGTAMFKYGDVEIEFVGARKESYRRESRKPIVEDGTLEDDQDRRDFTINALAIDLTRENFGELIDPFGGLEHINQRIIITPLDPDITFSDDPLRMMRAIRFATQIDFEIASETLSSIRKNASRIAIISAERIIDEWTKIMNSAKPSKGLILMEELGLMPLICPEISQLRGVDTIDGKQHKDNFYHTVKVVDNLAIKSENVWLRWSALFHDIGKPRTKKYFPEIGWTFHGHDYIGSKMIPGIFKQIKLPLNDHMKYVQKMVLLHLRPISLVESVVSDSAIRRLLFDAGDDVDDLMTLCEADITSKNEIKVSKYLQNFNIVRRKLTVIEEKDRVRNFQPPISGELIMDVFNIKPGKEIGIIKNAIKEAILDGDINNQYDEAYQFMLKIGTELGMNPVSIK